MFVYLGNFGCVYMAVLKETEDENACRVAVKTLQGMVKCPIYFVYVDIVMKNN